MVEFICDDTEVEKALRKLHKQVIMMETMIELYNLTGKIAAQKKI